MMETTPRTVDRQNDLGQITILRIKRKRNEEPLDALRMEKKEKNSCCIKTVKLTLFLSAFIGTVLQDQSNAPDEKRLRKEGGNLSTSNLKSMLLFFAFCIFISLHLTGTWLLI